MDYQWNASLIGQVRHVALPDYYSPAREFALHEHLMAAGAPLERSEKPV